MEPYRKRRPAANPSLKPRPRADRPRQLPLKAKYALDADRSRVGRPVRLPHVAWLLRPDPADLDAQP
jgi:hypothetical protein